MDNRYRNYYVIRPKYPYKEYVIKNLKIIYPNMKFHNQEFSYSIIMSCDKCKGESVEYELNKWTRDIFGYLNDWYQIESMDDVETKNCNIFGFIRRVVR